VKKKRRTKNKTLDLKNLKLTARPKIQLETCDFQGSAETSVRQLWLQKNTANSQILLATGDFQGSVKTSVRQLWLQKNTANSQILLAAGDFQGCARLAVDNCTSNHKLGALHF
jgi:hypothetical protein